MHEVTNCVLNFYRVLPANRDQLYSTAVAAAADGTLRVKLVLGQLLWMHWLQGHSSAAGGEVHPCDHFEVKPSEHFG